MTELLVAFIVMALLFAFLNGLHDSANVVATMIASRALSPHQALWMTAAAEFCGPFLFGTAVATTIGSDLLVLDELYPVFVPLLLAAVTAAVCFGVVTLLLGFPSSSSHALIGGIVGAGACASLGQHAGVDLFTLEDIYAALRAVRPDGLAKVLLALLISPLAGFAAGYGLLKAIRFFARGATPSINAVFRHGQVATAMGLALVHGSNDAQKTMGLLTIGLVAAGVLPEFSIPVWVVSASAGAIALGTAIGGRRLIRTLAGGLYTIRPVHGFTTQIGSGAVILTASLLGGPVSTTQVVASAIMGSGSAERFSKVRWGLGRQIVLAWAVTTPVTAVLAAILYVVMRRFS